MKEVSQVDCLIYLVGNNCINKWGCPFSRYFNDNGMARFFFVITISDKFVFEVVAFLRGLFSEERHSIKSICFRQPMIRYRLIEKVWLEMTKKFLATLTP
jgi:hypothetical protein